MFKKIKTNKKHVFHNFFITLIMEVSQIKAKFWVNTWINWKYILKDFHLQNFPFWSALDADVTQKWHSLLEKSQKKRFFHGILESLGCNSFFFNEIEVCSLFHSICSKIFCKAWRKKIVFQFFSKPVFISFEKRIFWTPLPPNFENYERVKLLYSDALNLNISIRTEKEQKMFCGLPTVTVDWFVAWDSTSL